MTGKQTISSSCVLFVVCVPVFAPPVTPESLTRKFLQEKLDKVRPATAEERKEILSSTHAESHMGENMLFNMIWEDGYWWETLWKECKKLTCSCKECMFFNIGRKGFHLVSTI